MALKNQRFSPLLQIATTTLPCPILFWPWSLLNPWRHPSLSYSHSFLYEGLRSTNPSWQGRSDRPCPCSRTGDFLEGLCLSLTFLDPLKDPGFHQAEFNPCSSASSVTWDPMTMHKECLGLRPKSGLYFNHQWANSMFSCRSFLPARDMHMCPTAFLPLGKATSLVFTERFL